MTLNFKNSKSQRYTIKEKAKNYNKINNKYL